MEENADISFEGRIRCRDRFVLCERDETIITVAGISLSAASRQKSPRGGAYEKNFHHFWSCPAAGHYAERRHAHSARRTPRAGSVDLRPEQQHRVFTAGIQ